MAENSGQGSGVVDEYQQQWLAVRAMTTWGYVWSSDTPDHKNPNARPTFSESVLEALFRQGIARIEVATSEGSRYALSDKWLKFLEENGVSCADNL